MKKNLCKKIMYITFICFVIILVSTNSVFAELNPTNMENATANKIADIITTILGVGMGALAAPLISLAFMLLMVIFSFMYFLFSPVSGGGAFPFPDQIIFNQLAFFDPNFLNPPSVGTSPVGLLQDLIKNMYYSFYVIATAIFLIAIMIISIKLAISTIASDKAQYKKALTNWAFGLLLLFLLPFLMAGAFKLNETIVNSAYKAMDTSNIEFTITSKSIIDATVGAATGGIGLTISKAITGIANFVTGGLLTETSPLPPIKGYGGMILKYMVDAASGNLVGLIICGILLGQSAALIFQYVKRLFYCIILGMLAPLIIAADIVKHDVINKSGFPLFSSWLKQFMSTVFLQSFHAVFLMFTMVMLSQLQTKTTGSVKTDGILAIVSITCAMALIKFEKMIKKLFGIEDSPVGNTAGAGAKMFMGAKSAIDLGRTATSGFKRSRDANKNLKDIQDKRKSKQDSYDRLFNPEEYNKRNPNKKVPTAASARAESIYNSATSGGTQVGGAGQVSGQGGSAEYGAPGSRSDFNRMLEQERRKEELDDLEAQEIKARKTKRATGIDKYLNAAGTLASISVGLGAADELSESLTISNLINKPLDVITDKYSNGVAGREIYNESKEKYTKENDALIAAGKSPKFVDDDGNRNEVERASKVLEKSITTSIKDGLKDYGGTVVKNSPIKMTVDQVTKFQINHEVKGNKKDLEKIRELQKRQGGNVENI